jgi:hypothetical protein
MRELINHWLYYGLGREQYKKCMEKMFADNIYSLRLANALAIILPLCFAFFPLLIEKKFSKVSAYIISASVAMILSAMVNLKAGQHKLGNKVQNWFIYAMIIAFYLNIITFGIYLGVFANPGKLAAAFMCILICALLLFNISPLFNLCLTLGAAGVFIAFTIHVKKPDDWNIDMVNAIFAAVLGVFIGWHLTMYRLSLAVALDNKK